MGRGKLCAPARAKVGPAEGLLVLQEVDALLRLEVAGNPVHDGLAELTFQSATAFPMGWISPRENTRFAPMGPTLSNTRSQKRVLEITWDRSYVLCEKADPSSLHGGLVEVVAPQMPVPVGGEHLADAIANLQDSGTHPYLQTHGKYNVSTCH